MTQIGSRVHDRLIAGNNVWLVTETLTLLSGQNVVRGEVLGQISLGAAPSAVPDGGNTGDGTAGAITLGSKTKVGVYRLECVEAITNGGRFMVLDPDGNRLGDLLVGTAYTGSHLNLTISDGSADFIVGDFFTVTTVAGSDKLKVLQSGSVDGSNKFHSVAAQDVDASAADKSIVVYKTGEFSIDALTFDGSDTFDDYKAEMRQVNCHGKTTIDVSGQKQP